MKFSEIQYERPDLDRLKEELAALTQRFREAKTFEEADTAYVAVDALQGRSLRTMRTVAQIRRDIDTTDAFYDGEVAFFNQELPKLQPLQKAWTKATLESPFRKELEEKYGSVTFRTPRSA